MKNIKAIIFDAYGTLFDVNSAAEKCKNKIYFRKIGYRITKIRKYDTKYDYCSIYISDLNSDGS